MLDVISCTFSAQWVVKFILGSGVSWINVYPVPGQGQAARCVINLKYNNNHKIFAFCSLSPPQRLSGHMGEKLSRTKPRPSELSWLSARCPVSTTRWHLGNIYFLTSRYLHRDRYLLYKDNVLLLVDIPIVDCKMTIYQGGNNVSRSICVQTWDTCHVSRVKDQTMELHSYTHCCPGWRRPSPG